MVERSAETHIALMEADILSIKERQSAQDLEIERLSSERNRALLWGVITLGGFVVALLAAIAGFLKDHIK